MLSSISWTQYWIVVGISTISYYAFVIIKFYPLELRSFFSGGGKKKPVAKPAEVTPASKPVEQQTVLAASEASIEAPVAAVASASAGIMGKARTSVQSSYIPNLETDYRNVLNDKYGDEDESIAIDNEEEDIFDQISLETLIKAREGKELTKEEQDALERFSENLFSLPSVKNILEEEGDINMSQGEDENNFNETQQLEDTYTESDDMQDVEIEEGEYDEDEFYDDDEYYDEENQDGEESDEEQDDKNKK